MKSACVGRPGVGVRLAGIVALIAGFCAVFASSAGAALPEFNLLGHNGGTNITTMNMTSGTFSGSAVVDGEEFEVQGTESGNESISTFTYIADPSYVSTNTDFYEILSNGNVGGPGSFHDTNGYEESYTGEINEPAGTTPSVTSVTCTPAGSSYPCTATVSGASGPPTGNVTFTASGGGFAGEPACALAAGSCSVTYTPPATSASSTPITVKAVYSADQTFRVSQGSTTICGSGGVAVTGATPESDASDGAVPGSKVKLAGKGLCPGMVVQFGNEKATASVVAGPDLATDGTSATVVVPQLATSGTLSISSAGQQASLAEEFKIDSFRNTVGLSFPNIFSYQTSVAEFEAAFGADNVTFITGSGLTDNLTPRAREIYEHFVPELSHGLCFGWSLAALRFDTGAVPLASYDPDADVPWDLSQTPQLVSTIASDMWQQFSEQQELWKRDSAASQLVSLNALEAALEPGFDTDGDRPDGTLLTYGWKNAEGKWLAHTAIAYAMEPTGSPDEPGEQNLYLANSSLPFTSSENSTDGRSHDEIVHRSALQIKPTGEGGYVAYAGAQKVEMYAEEPIVLNGSLTPDAPPGVVNSWFTPGTNLDDLLDSSGKSLSVGDLAEGILPEPVLDENAPATASFSAPLAAYDETVSGAAGVGDLLETPDLTAEVKATGGTDSVAFDPTTDTLGIAPPPAAGAAAASDAHTATAAGTVHATASHAATLTLIAQQPDHSERTLVVSGPAAYTASLARGVTVTNTNGHTEAVRLTLGDDAHTPQEFVSSAIEIPAKGKLTAKPRWTALAGSLTVTIAGRGHRARRAKLANRARPLAATITKITPTGPKGSRSVVIHLHVPALGAGSSVTVTAHVLSGSHVVRAVTSKVTLPAKPGSVALTVELGATPTKHARLKVVAITAAEGSAITVAQRKRTVALG
jgi:hypothetical protein